ncbi:NAD(P)/FAD-dependent oxidoreductase [Streptomyces amakusaensis]|uniref:NAD(P)/FAD-dependent oxidoreductase n=1 Tax=Streptomyces amakusaensis TaxID=67271 RepID=A0ABW0AKS2_9ACTN
MRTVIIGAGIGGLALAAILQRNDADYIVHERRAHITTEGSGLVLHPNGLDALDRIESGFRAVVTAAGYAIPDDTPTFVLAGDGATIREWVPAPSERSVTIRRAELRRLLHERSERTRIRLGSTFLQYAESGSSLQVFVTEKRIGTRTGSLCQPPLSRDPDVQDFAADVLIGADGMRSVVRRQLLADGGPRPMGLTSVRSVVRLVHDDPRLWGGFVLFGRGHQVFCSPLGPDILYWDVTLRSSHPVLRERVNLRRNLLARDWGWPTCVREIIAAARPEDMIVTALHDRPGRTGWSRGAVTLMGDAAHPMSPFLGQGTNQALLDAVVLAESLGSHGSDLADAFSDYETNRRDCAYRAMRDSRRIGFRGQTRNPLSRWLRDRAVRAPARAVTSK